MKKLLLVLILLFSAQHQAHAQSCINEGEHPPVSPQAEEVTRSSDFDDLIEPTKNGHGAVLVEFYNPGCCFYNGNVGVVNQIMQLYPSIKVIQISSASEAGRNRGKHLGSPEYHLYVNNHDSITVGAMGERDFLTWLSIPRR